MRREWLILGLALIGVILISGCVEQDGVVVPEYHDEALKMEFEMTGEVLPKQAINMKVQLTNQVEHKVDDVEVRITDFYGLKMENQICGSGTAISSTECGFISDECGCTFSEIQSLDDEEISFVFKVPSEEEIARIGRELQPEITLKYSYSGVTTFLIPILGLNERSTSATIQSVQTKGPIHVDIERGFTSSSKSWEREDDGFSIVVRVRDVLNPRNELTIKKENFGLTFDHLTVTLDFGRCDFNNSQPNNDIELPMKVPLVCALQAGGTGGAPWVYGSVIATYNYEYKDVETKSIMIETIIA